ncbi:hypothetical protein BN2497_14393 [Janthinobacterium sp. CG23_2]|nr:hypothetical protein BN2497_14393 [Janthinobacterium sp. CG23_2]CUU33594.1 hypothetical protein BN3177_14393 [Janthinobacterium sp. CG23_2]
MDILATTLSVQLPLRYLGGDLGLTDGEEPWIDFADNSGKRFLTHSVEWLLRNIELFAEGRDREQPLACAANHYGFSNVYALMGREVLCDVRDFNDRILLAGVTQESAYWAADEYQSRPEWAGEVRVRFRRAAAGNNRHEGPLVLLHHGADAQGVGVKSHVGRCGLTIEEALRRLDQFSAAHQAELLAGLSERFNLAVQEECETAGAV